MEVTPVLKLTMKSITLKLDFDYLFLRLNGYIKWLGQLYMASSEQVVREEQ